MSFLRIGIIAVFMASLVAADEVAVTPAQPANCGAASICDLCALLGQPLDADQKDGLARATAGAETSLLALQQACSQLDLDLVGVQATLRELDRLPGAKIIALGAPAHFTVLIRANDEWAQLMDGGRLMLVRSQALSERYTGYALVVSDLGQRDGPHLALDGFYYDAGWSSVGAMQTRLFRVRNTGKEELTLKADAGSCAGPRVVLEPETILPGKWGKILVSFRVGETGRVIGTAKVLSNDLAQPVVYISIRCKVPRDVYITPTKLVVPADPDCMVVRTVQLVAPNRFALKQAICRSGVFSVAGISSEPASEKGFTRWIMRVMLNPRSQPGEVTDELQIQVASSLMPTFKVPLIARIRSRLVVEPHTIYCGFVSRSDQMLDAGSVRIRCLASSPAVRIEQVSVDSHLISPGRPVYENGVWSIPVRLNVATAGVIAGRVSIRLNVRHESVHTVPVYAQIVEDE